MNQEKLYHEAKSDRLSLFDKEGNKTYVMKKLEEIYHRGQYGVFNLLTDKTNTPLGLSSKTVWELVHGKKKKSIRRDHFEYLIKEFEFPTNVNSCISNIPEQYVSSDIDRNIIYVQLLDDEGKPTGYLEDIRKHHHRTAVGETRLLRDKKDIPVGLNKTRIKNWLQGRLRSAQLNHVNYVLDLWETFPDADMRIPITPEIRDKLLGLVLNTNIKAKTFIKETRGRAPKNFKSIEIASWIDGKAKSASRIHLEFFMNELENIQKCRKKFVVISTDVRNQMLFEQQRTRISSTALLKEQNDLPEGLIKSWVAGWLSGRIVMAEEFHLDYVLKKWQEIPSMSSYYTKPSGKPSHEKMPRTKRSIPVMEEISEEVRELLRSKFGRGAMTARVFIKRFSPVPHGLTERSLSCWMSGAIKKARKSQLTFVLDNLDKLPNLLNTDNKINKIPLLVNRVTINEKEILEMKSHQKRTGIGSHILLKNAEAIPEG